MSDDEQTFQTKMESYAASIHSARENILIEIIKTANVKRQEEELQGISRQQSEVVLENFVHDFFGVPRSYISSAIVLCATNEMFEAMKLLVIDARARYLADPNQFNSSLRITDPWTIIIVAKKGRIDVLEWLKNIDASYGFHWFEYMSIIESLECGAIGCEQTAVSEWIDYHRRNCGLPTIESD